MQFNSTLEFKYEISKLPITNNNPLKVINDIFPYGGIPSEKLSSSSSYYKTILNDFIVQNEAELNDWGDDDWVKIDADKINQQLYTIVDDHIKTIYTMIDYPLTNQAVIKFECNEPITYGMLLFLYTNAYQIVYDIEESDDCDPGQISNHCLNRATSKGRFGIWGHSIGDLCYNGSSIIHIYNDHIVCNFDCDS